MSTYYYGVSDSLTLAHHGIKGMHWGIRRYQNADGTLTEAGIKRRQKLEAKQEKLNNKLVAAQKRTAIAKAKSEEASYKKSLKESKDALKKQSKEEKKIKKLENEKKLAEAEDKLADAKKSTGQKIVEAVTSEQGKALLKTAASALIESQASKYISGLEKADTSDIAYVFAKSFAKDAKTKSEKREAAAEKATKDKNDKAKSEAEYAKNVWQKAMYENNYAAEKAKTQAAVQQQYAQNLHNVMQTPISSLP